MDDTEKIWVCVVLIDNKDYELVTPCKKIIQIWPLCIACGLNLLVKPQFKKIKAAFTLPQSGVERFFI